MKYIIEKLSNNQYAGMKLNKGLHKMIFEIHKRFN